ncbi:peroxide stress protein YaaA [Flavobacteriaceae bacterium Ap0902]|nr:peroxide stress protein YaaA [Flavobacteriaceae bacterium Ap0902]
MKIFLSPAKRLDENPEKEWSLKTKPQFLKNSKELMNTLKEKSPQDLMKLMKISEDLADLNYERNQKWQNNPKKSDSYSAGLMFDGEVYRGFRENAFSEDQLNYLNKNVYILSGLYGILSPTDMVMPYRLEMGTKLKVKEKENLHDYWKDTLTQYVNDNTEEDEILLNLASKEYMGALDTKKLHGKVIDFKFKDYKNGDLKQITVYMKKARGEMANWCIQNNANTIDDLKKFNRMDYQYDDNLSTDNTLIYTR